MTAIARYKKLWAWLAAVVLLIILSAALAQIEFSFGEEQIVINPFTLMGRNQAPAAEGPSQGKALNFWDVLFRVVLWLFLPIAVVYYVVAAIISPEGRTQALAIVILLLLLLVFLAVFKGLALKPAEEATATPLPAGQPVLPPDSQVPEIATPDWLIWVVTAGLALLLGGVAASVWLRLRGRRERPLQELARQAQEALDEVRAGGSLHDAVTRCYLEMSRILSEQRGVRRQVSMTTREFERRLGEVGLPREDVWQLTRLFEAVRYGAKTPGLVEEREATACLMAIARACERLA